MARDVLTPGLRSRVSHYGRSHQSPVNIGLHLVGIPALLVASLGLLAHVALPADTMPAVLRPNAAWLALLAACVWYCYFDWKVGLVTWAGWAIAYAAGSHLSVGACVAVFIAGSVAHLIGHFGFEGRPPEFFRRPIAVFEAPAWLVATLAQAEGAGRIR